MDKRKICSNLNGLADSNLKHFLIKVLDYLTLEPNMKIRVLLYLLLSLLTSIIGCRAPAERIAIKPPYDTPLLPGQDALRKVTNPSEIPDFTLDCLDLQDLKPAVERSLNYLSKPSSKQFFPVSGITHKQAV
ncbi:MAG: hypothetical protein ACYS4T_12200, partial [Planctomycetota bacterium]